MMGQVAGAAVAALLQDFGAGMCLLSQVCNPTLINMFIMLPLLVSLTLASSCDGTFRGCANCVLWLLRFECQILNYILSLNSGTCSGIIGHRADYTPTFMHSCSSNCTWTCLISAIHALAEPADMHSSQVVHAEIKRQ